MERKRKQVIPTRSFSLAPFPLPELMSVWYNNTYPIPVGKLILLQHKGETRSTRSVTVTRSRTANRLLSRLTAACRARRYSTQAWALTFPLLSSFLKEACYLPDFQLFNAGGYSQQTTEIKLLGVLLACFEGQETQIHQIRILSLFFHT